MTAKLEKRDITSGTAICVPGNDIDTDRIIPARFLRCVTFEGLGEYAFYDERFDENNQPKEHPFNEERAKSASILVANRNFGCGSSREHAPQALMRFGIKAVIAESYAEIFAGNCLAMGIPAVTATHDIIEEIMEFVYENPDTPLTIDLETMTVQADGQTYSIGLPDAARKLLIKGDWDSTTQLLANSDLIDQTAKSLPYVTNFA